MTIIPRTHPRLQYTTVEDILKGSCPTCGYSLTVRSIHLGGHGASPYVCCTNPNGGQTPEHVLLRIPLSLAADYQLFAREEEDSFGAWYEEQEVTP